MWRDARELFAPICRPFFLVAVVYLAILEALTLFTGMPWEMSFMLGLPCSSVALLVAWWWVDRREKREEELKWTTKK